MDQHFFVIVFTALCVQSSSGEEREAMRNFIGSVASDVTCESTPRCEMTATDSVGCHFYRNVDDGALEPCLIETYIGNTPKIYVKPEKNFQYMDINTHHRVCSPAFFGLGNLGTRRLYSDDFHDLESWHEVRVHANKKHKIYQVFLDDEKKIGKPMTFKSLNHTRIQIMVKGPVLWSYECDPRDYQQLLSRPALPWIMFFSLAILLVIMLVCIIVYCSRKLKRQSRARSDYNSFKASTRSTISLISSPAIFQSQSHHLRFSDSSCSQSSPHRQVTPSSSVAGGCSNASGCNVDPSAQGWSYTANANVDSACKKWIKSHMLFQNRAKAAATNSMPEHIYEDPEEHLYEEADAPPCYENQDEPIYEEIDDFCDQVVIESTKRPMVPLNRVDSLESSFSTANSVYGFR